MKSCSLLTVTALTCSAAAAVSTAAEAGPPVMFPPPVLKAHAGPAGPSPAALWVGLRTMRGPSPMLARGIGPMGGPILARAGLTRFGGPAMMARGLGPMAMSPVLSRAAFRTPAPGAMAGPPPFARGGPGFNYLAFGLGPFGRPGMGGGLLQRAGLGGMGMPPFAGIPMAGFRGPNPSTALMSAAFRPGLQPPPSFLRTGAGPGFAPMLGGPWMVPPGGPGARMTGPSAGPFAGRVGPAGMAPMPGIVAAGFRNGGPSFGAAALRLARLQSTPFATPYARGRGLMAPRPGALPGGAPVPPAILAGIGSLGPARMMSRPAVLPAALHRGIGPLGGFRPAVARPGSFPMPMG
jgi:hypothetical protein